MHTIDLFRKLFVLLLTRGSGLILTFAISLFLARIFGADITGKYYLFISILTGMSIITKLGFNSTLIKYCAHHSIVQEKENIRGYWYTANKISFFLSALIITLIICLNELGVFSSFVKDTYQLFVYACIGLIPFTILGHNIAVLIGLNRQATASVTDTIALPSLFLCLIGIVYFHDPIQEEILALYTAALIIVFMISTLILFKQLHSNKKTEHANTKIMLTRSMPVLGINLTNFLTDWSATYILAIFGTLGQIGIYNISWRLVTIMGIVLVVFNSINAPQYSKDFKKGNIDNIDKTTRRTNIILFWLGLPVIGIIIIFAENIMGLFGDEFIQGTAILQILAVGQIFNFATGSVGYLLLMTGHEKELRNLTLSTCVVQIIAMLIFIPQYNIYAAAIITALAITTKNILSAYIAYKNLGVLSLPIPKNRIIFR
ncbi:MAG: oligosaccharide flippase family protein [Gammaproteobacteria bacterium]|nr:oligosaccharide flippase family protein [Gammaproteobacteria bacterium]